MLGPNGERISASAFERAEQCLFPWAADKKEHPWDRSSSKAARIGTAVHHLIEVHMAGIYKPMPKDISAAEQALAKPFFDQWLMFHQDRPFAGEAETKLWYRPNKGLAGKEVGGANRGYSELPWDGWIGTADLWSPKEVTDWKTGQHQVFPEHSSQMAKLALLTSKVGGEKEVTATVVQISPTGVTIRSHLYTEFELYCVATRLDAVLDNLVRKRTEPRPSEDACRWCPIKKTCPQAYDKNKQRKISYGL